MDDDFPSAGLVGAIAVLCAVLSLGFAGFGGCDHEAMVIAGAFLFAPLAGLFASTALAMSTSRAGDTRRRQGLKVFGSVAAGSLIGTAVFYLAIAVAFTVCPLD